MDGVQGNSVADAAEGEAGVEGPKRDHVFRAYQCRMAHSTRSAEERLRRKGPPVQGDRDPRRQRNPARPAPTQARLHQNVIPKTAATRNPPVLLISLAAPDNPGPDDKTEFDARDPDLAAQCGARLVPCLFAPRLSDNDPTTPSTCLQSDGIHPKAEGVAKLVDGLGPQALELIGRVPKAPEG